MTTAPETHRLLECMIFYKIPSRWSDRRPAMQSFKIEKLKDDIRTGGAAYVRNLAAAEDAVMKGQFNLAKVLRAAAHSQRIIAMTIARLYPWI